MASEVVMPQMGADMTEGTLLRWLKQEGESVDRGEIIAEIETDKANIEIEAFEGGVFRKALANEGDVVKVGEVIAVIASANEDISRYSNGAAPSGAVATARAQPAQQQQAARAKAPVERAAAHDAAPEVGAAPTDDLPPVAAAPMSVRPPQPATNEVAAPPAEEGRLRVSPLARRIAQDRGVDLRGVRGSGPDGRIVKRDVESLNGAPPTPAATPVATARLAARASDAQVQPSRMRQAIARRMSQSKREAPHYYLLVDIDMTDAMALRKQVNAALDEASRVSINDLIVRASALALQRHPQFNATIEGEQVTEWGEQNVCIAIALDEGLIAPAIIDTGSKPLVEIARDAKDLVERAKRGSLRPEEVTAGTFTITNLGAYGIETLIGIIQPPQTARLGTGSVMEQPVAREGQVV
ncbi:MAG TPA: dihydrolipoamide acetyltransferase family protein, partial [Dehalococcoidia bacterium]